MVTLLKYLFLPLTIIQHFVHFVNLLLVFLVKLTLINHCFIIPLMKVQTIGPFINSDTLLEFGVGGVRA